MSFYRTELRVMFMQAEDTDKFICGVATALEHRDEKLQVAEETITALREQLAGMEEHF